MQTILFLCTGNYYRSRFSEILFNHLAHQGSLDWQAKSRGLALERGRNNFGAISKYAQQGLCDRNIQLPQDLRAPLPLTLTALKNAQRVIAVDETEHRPLMQTYFPDWENKIDYWCIHDLDRSTPTEALAQLDDQIQALLPSL